MAKVSCPRCQQLVDSQAITCPSCHITLKAYGHPGIPLHRATGEDYLCDTCTYHSDDSCNFPQRPYAKDCTLYQNVRERNSEIYQQRQQSSWAVTATRWLQRHQGWLLLLALLLVCLVIAISTS